MYILVAGAAFSVKICFWPVRNIPPQRLLLKKVFRQSKGLFLIFSYCYLITIGIQFLWDLMPLSSFSFIFTGL